MSESSKFLQPAPMVFVAAVGRSYFEQILPASSVTLGWSALDQLEAGTAARLSAAPVRMTIPLAQIIVVKANNSARKSAR